MNGPIREQRLARGGARNRMDQSELLAPSPCQMLPSDWFFRLRMRERENGRRLHGNFRRSGVEGCLLSTEQIVVKTS